jgi:hypothetical protein
LRASPILDRRDYEDDRARNAVTPKSFFTRRKFEEEILWSYGEIDKPSESNYCAPFDDARQAFFKGTSKTVWFHWWPPLQGLSSIDDPQPFPKYEELI